MIDFQIQRGPSELILSDRLIIENGCWYLCEDTAELYLGIKDKATGELTLKQINGDHDKESIDPAVLELLNTEINKVKESLSDYAKKTDLPNVEGFATKEFVNEAIAKIEHPANPTKVSELENDANYATEQYVIDAIEAHEGIAKKEEVEEVKTKLETEVLPKVEKVEEIEPTVSELKTWVENKEYLQDIDLEGYATEEFVNQKIAEAELADQDVDLSAYYTKSETEAAIKAAVDTIDIPEVPTKVSELENDANYTKGFVLDLGGYNQGNNWEVDISSTFEEFVSVPVYPHPILYVTYNNNSLLYPARVRCNNGSFYEIEANVTKITTTPEFETQQQVWLEADITQPTTGTWIARCYLRKLNAASTSYVDKKIDAINIPETDLSNYYNKSETETLVNEAVNGINIPDTSDFITMEDVEGKRYLTSGDIANKADKSELINLATKEEVIAVENKIPSLTDYATKQDVADAIAGIDMPEAPEVNLENYHTKAEVTELLSVKADEVPFKTTKFVKNPIGGFVAGEDVKGLTVAELFAKLLGLTDEPGENPDEPKGLIETIIANDVSMYSITKDGVLAKTAFKLVDGNEPPIESGFYVIKDAQGNIVEAGYQDLSVENEEMYYMIALPKEVDYNTMVELTTWDPDESIWVESGLALTSDAATVSRLCDEAGVDISHIDTNTYTVWAIEDLCTGSIIRYRIKEEL